MNTPAEQELSRVLRERAATIDVPPDYRFEPDQALAPLEARRRDRRTLWTMFVSSVAAAAMVAIGIAAARWGLSHDRTPSARTVVCAPGASSPLVAAIAKGMLPKGDVILAEAHDGTLLVAAERGGVTMSVEAMSPTGAVSRLWTAGPTDRMRVVANRSGAINGGQAAFVLIPVSGAGAAQVLVADLTDSSLVRIAVDRGYRVTADPQLAPLAMADAVVMLEVSRANPRIQRTVSSWVRTVPASGDVRSRTSGVSSLLAVGGNVVTIRMRAGGWTGIDFDEPRYRPTTLRSPVHRGYGFTSDDTTMSWLGTAADQTTLWQWSPGDPEPTWRIVPDTVHPSTAAGSFAIGRTAGRGDRQQVFDATTDRVIELPVGVELFEAGAMSAVLAVATPNSSVRYSRVSVVALDNC